MATSNGLDGDWASLIGQAEERPTGWQTLSEISKEIGIPPRTLVDRLRREVARGVIECREFSVMVKGYKRQVNCYRIKPGKRTKR